MYSYLQYSIFPCRGPMSPSLLPSFERGKLRILTGSSFTNAFGGDENYPIQKLCSCLSGHSKRILCCIYEFTFSALHYLSETSVLGLCVTCGEFATHGSVCCLPAHGIKLIFLWSNSLVVLLMSVKSCVQPQIHCSFPDILV
jgi:hypothetical protein